MEALSGYPAVGVKPSVGVCRWANQMARRSTPEEKRASAVALAVAVMEVRDSLQAHRNELLSICVWKWTEAHGKYRGCRYWTRAALDADQRQLAHEHVVPRRQLVRALIDLPTASEEAVVDLLTRMGVACVVTRNEHDRLPEAPWAELVVNPWARYEGVEVVDTWAARPLPSPWFPSRRAPKSG